MDIYDEIEERHSEEMQDIIGTPPSWLLRWGIMVFFFILILIIGAASFVRYPDTIKAPLKIYSLSPPRPIDALAAGKLTAVSIQNGQWVKKGSLLAIIEDQSGKKALTALQDGILTYAGIVHEGEQVLLNQHLFYIENDDNNFFGEMPLSPTDIAKVKAGQAVMIKIKSYPYQEYGMLHGNIKYVAGGTTKNDEYVAEVDFGKKPLTDMNRLLTLKYGMMADAQIITQSNSVLKRIVNSLFKNIHY